MSAAPRPRVGGRRAPVARLASLNKTPQPGSIPIKRPQGRLQPRVTQQSGDTCPNPNCPNPQIIEDEDMKVCAGCGTVLSEENIVSEVTFGETSSGAAIVQGSYVGADQTHTRSYGPGFQRGGGMDSREITEQTGNRYIQTMSHSLDIPESATKAAGQVFKLAVGLNFIQGRRTKTVAAVCLYIACRRQSGNTVMLIDLADVLMINVFKLGRAYKLLLEELRLGGTVFLMNPVDPENLIYRFARQLEFGNRTMQVAKEACRIVQRMNRDWMTTGRRPAGICGAALILAARMNNFRRTVREVVYVVKVTEVTINQRLNEFSSTDSGELTIDQFRSVHLENAHDPPSFTQGKAGKDRKRKAPENAADIEDDEESTHTHTHRKNRVDADGFAVPDLPIDPRLLGNRDPPATDSGQKRKPASSGDGEDNFSADMSRPLRKKNRTDRESSLDESVSIDAVETAESSTAEQSAEASSQPKPKRGRPKKVPPPPPTAEELASEEALEDEMNQFLAQGSDMIEVVAKETETPVLKKPVSESRDIDASEFDSDPEVANCLLSAAEVEIKERIWVHENKDYLRTQQAKALKRALLQVEGEENGGVKPRRRRKGRLGDVTYLEGEDGTSSRASTPAEATRLMLEKRGFSKKINYKLLESLYGEEGAQQVAKAKAELASRSSRSQSVASQGSIIAEPSISDPKIAATAVSTESSAEHSSAHVPTQSSSKSIFQLDGDEGDDEYGDDGYEGDGDDGYGDNDQARIQAALGGDYGEEEQQQEEEDYYDQASDYDYD